jgi:rod shape-determining protein MreB
MSNESTSTMESPEPTEPSTTTPAPELTATPPPAPEPVSQTAPAATPQSNASYILAGVDIGTNTSCVHAINAETGEDICAVVVPSIVGFSDHGILAGILPGDSQELFGFDALDHGLHLKITHPLVDGVIKDLEATTKFVNYLRGLIDPSGKATIHAVVGIPSKADEDARDNLQKAISGAFDAAFLVPEPFLAAYGFRDENRLGQPEYIDPVKNSLFIDIGAGTTDYCIIQGYFPTPEDQLSMPVAGDEVDEHLSDSLATDYPDTKISPAKIREYKEQFSYVGEPQYGMKVRVPVAGKPRTIEIGKQVGEACNMLLDKIFESLEQVIPMARPDSVFELLSNIILTGGGSMIKNMPEELQRMLLESGYEDPHVRAAGEDFKIFVAQGALKVARATKPEQWANSKL